jgi:hypothetical protein
LLVAAQQAGYSLRMSRFVFPAALVLALTLPPREAHA